MSDQPMTYGNGFGTHNTLRGVYWMNALFALLTVLIALQSARAVDQPGYFFLWVTAWLVAIHWRALKLLMHLRRLEQQLTAATPSMKLMYETAGTLPVIALLPMLALQMSL